jgi:hypothetical protein
MTEKQEESPIIFRNLGAADFFLLDVIVYASLPPFGENRENCNNATEITSSKESFLPLN